MTGLKISAIKKPGRSQKSKHTKFFVVIQKNPSHQHITYEMRLSKPLLFVVLLISLCGFTSFLIYSTMSRQEAISNEQPVNNNHAELSKPTPEPCNCPDKTEGTTTVVDHQCNIERESAREAHKQQSDEIAILQEKLKQKEAEVKPATSVVPKDYFTEERLTDMDVLKPEGECHNAYDFYSVQNWRKGKTGYCLPDASKDLNSDMFCYHNKFGHNGGGDVFCQMHNVKFDNSNYQISCVEQSHPPFNNFPTFMYETGLGNYIRRVQMGQNKQECTKTIDEPLYVMKREGAGNLFHCMTDFFSMYWTLAILGKQDDKNIQIAVLDGHGHGTFWNLWKAYSDKDAIATNQLQSGTCYREVVFIIPGGSCPFWKGDWTPYPCRDSRLFQSFARKLISYYNYDKLPAPKETVLTFISRKQTRQLAHEEEYFNELHQMFPKVKIQRIDFAAIPFDQQMKVVRETNILVGVHGSGMTHLLWLPDEAVVVEIFPPGIHKSTFRNMAKLTNKIYMSERPPGGENNWANNAVSLEKGKFMELMKAAIAVTNNFDTSTVEHSRVY